jgi:hypothetical protein
MMENTFHKRILSIPIEMGKYKRDEEYFIYTELHQYSIWNKYSRRWNMTTLIIYLRIQGKN